MTSNAAPDHDPAELGELERDILSIVWRVGNGTAEQVREELDRPLKDSTVRTVLRRLEEKGYLTHTTENRTFLTGCKAYRRLVLRGIGGGVAGRHGGLEGARPRGVATAR